MLVVGLVVGRARAAQLSAAPRQQRLEGADHPGIDPGRHRRVPLPGLGRGDRDVAGRAAHRAGLPRVQGARPSLRRPGPGLAAQRVAADLRRGGRRSSGSSALAFLVATGVTLARVPGWLGTGHPRRVPRLRHRGVVQQPVAVRPGQRRRVRDRSASVWRWRSVPVRRATDRPTRSASSRARAGRRRPGARLTAHAHQSAAPRRHRPRGRGDPRRGRPAATARGGQPRPGDRTAARRARPLRVAIVPGPRPPDPGLARPGGRAARPARHRARRLGRHRLPAAVLRAGPGRSRQPAGQPARARAVGRPGRGGEGRRGLGRRPRLHPGATTRPRACRRSSPRSRPRSPA